MEDGRANSRRRGTLDEPTVAAEALCSVLEETNGVDRSVNGLPSAMSTARGYSHSRRMSRREQVLDGSLSPQPFTTLYCRTPGSL